MRRGLAATAVVLFAVGCGTDEDPAVAEAAETACERVEGQDSSLGQSLAIVASIEDGMDEDAYAEAVERRCGDQLADDEPMGSDDIIDMLEEG